VMVFRAVGGAVGDSNDWLPRMRRLLAFKRNCAHAIELWQRKYNLFSCHSESKCIKFAIVFVFP
jgi:hypothetical protein